MTDFSKCPIGTRVISMNWGDCIISEIKPEWVTVSEVNYPLQLHSYTYDGKFNQSNAYPTLFLPEDFPLKEVKENLDAEPEVRVEPAIIKYGLLLKYKTETKVEYYIEGSTLCDTIEAALSCYTAKRDDFVKVVPIEIEPEHRFKKVVTWEEVK